MQTKTIVRPGGPRRFDLREMFAALRYPNYRLWFFSQMFSLVGTWMQSMAQGFLVFEITRSPAALGLVAAASGIATWMFTLYAGTLADRMSRRNLMVVTQSVMMLLAFVLAALTFTGTVQAWHIVVLSFLLGAANAFEAPARLAFVLEMVEREDLVNALALNSTMFNVGTAVGPAVAGLAYALAGPAWCFTLNGLSFIPVIIALAAMRLQPFVARARQASALEDVREGLHYVRHHRVIATLIAMIGTMSLFGLAFVTLFPAWAVNVLGGDVTTNGLMQSFRGAGALLAALMMAAMGRFKFKGRLLMLGALSFPLLAFVFALVRWVPLSLVLLAGSGWSGMIVMNMANTLVQTHVADELRGRVMGVYTLIFFGFMPIGALLIGSLADVLGEAVTVIGAAVAMLAVVASLYVFVPQIRDLE